MDTLLSCLIILKVQRCLFFHLQQVCQVQNEPVKVMFIALESRNGMVMVLQLIKRKMDRWYRMRTIYTARQLQCVI